MNHCQVRTLETQGKIAPAKILVDSPAGLRMHPDAQPHCKAHTRRRHWPPFLVAVRGATYGPCVRRTLLAVSLLASLVAPPPARSTPTPTPPPWPSKTPTATFIPVAADGTGNSLICRGGDRQGFPCASDADCSAGGTCTR